MSRQPESDLRPSPDALLRAAAQEGRGAGIDVVIGVVETHARVETEALTRGFEILPRRSVDYRDRTLTEMGLDAIIARPPQLVLVDELAPADAPESRHPERSHCLINLLDNAGKYADPGTPIAISAARRRDGIALSVTDEGPGLPPGKETQIFETFARLEGSDGNGGTGLGLAIVKGFAEAMGLMVAAARVEEPRGTRFTIHFPDAVIVRGSEAE